MTLYLIGLGLWDKEDITVKGLNAIKECDELYLEHYTSQLGVSVEELEEFYDKKITLADRAMVEGSVEEIVKKAKEKNIALLIVGDPLGATTHLEYVLEAKKQNTPVEIIHNTSILNAVGEIGLELYKFGKTISIPFDLSVTSPIEGIQHNLATNLHTLVLLDLNPGEKKFLQIPDACKYMIEKGLGSDQKVVGIAGLGSKNPEIKAATLTEMQSITFKQVPQCIIVVGGNLHFKEEEALERFK